MKNTTERKGFTLTELAVVIASVGVMTAVLMPTLAKARREAESAVCRANLKEIGTLVNFYASDNNGRMVPSSEYQHRWYHNLWAYYVADSNYKSTLPGGEYQVPTLYCPGEWRKRKSGTGIENDVTMYGYNQFFFCRVEPGASIENHSDDYVSPSWSYVWFSKISKVKDPATLPIFWDSSSDYSSGGMTGYPHANMYKLGWNNGYARSPKDNQTGPAPNHGANINYLFIDGHAGNMGLWPYNETVSPLNGSAMSFTQPGAADDYLTYFHPLRKLYKSGISGARTVGDGYPPDLPVR